MLSFTKSRLAGKTLLQTLFFFLLVTQMCFAQWVQTSLDSVGVNCFVVVGENLLAGTSQGGVYLSTNNGTSWSGANSGLTDHSVNALAVSDNNLFAGSSGGGVFLSTNCGTSWAPVNSGLTNFHVNALGASGTNLFAGTEWSGIFLSTNSGTNWTPVITGLHPYTNVVSFAFVETSLFAGAYGRFGGHMYLSTNNGTSWSDIGRGVNIASSGTNIIVATYWAELMGNGGWIEYSTNSGINWDSTTFGYVYCDPPCVAISGTNLFAGTERGGIFLSTNSGTNWTEVNEGLTDSNNVKSLFVCGAYLFAGTHNGVWRRPLSEIITDVGDYEQVQTEFLLSQNYPNPFNPSTKIKYSVPQTSQVQIKVFDVLGNEIETLIDEEKTVGTYELTWNAVDLPSGVYFYRIQAGSYVNTKKMLLLK